MSKRSWAERPRCLPVLALRVFLGGSRLDLPSLLSHFSPTFDAVSPSKQFSALVLARAGVLD